MRKFTQKHMQLPAPCLIIAEVGQAHDGSLGLAHAYIDAVAETGADAIKFQTHFAADESTSQEPWRVQFSKQDHTRYDYWKRMEFTPDQWKELKTHADSAGLLFLSSPFSLKAFELLKKLDVKLWKIASGEVSNNELFIEILRSNDPLLISTGLSTWQEIDTLVSQLKQNKSHYTLLQCTSKYPCPAEVVGLNVMETFQKKYRCPVGLSDHSGTIFPSLAAATLGASCIEVHITLSRKMFGPDTSSSLTPKDLKNLITGVRFIETMAHNPVDKDTIATELGPLRKTFTKSIITLCHLKAGTKLTSNVITVKKPLIGIPAKFYNSILGKTLAVDVEANHFITEKDLVEPLLNASHTSTETL
jgi:N,N'-diacetyllegionaminate synthase